VFFGGHSGQTLPRVASIGIGPCSGNAEGASGHGPKSWSALSLR